MIAQPCFPGFEAFFRPVDELVDDIEGLDGDGVFLRESFGDRSRFHIEGEDDRAGAGRHLHVGFGDRTHVGRDLLERDLVGYDGTEDLSDGLE